jgi:hypothetical protein
MLNLLIREDRHWLRKEYLLRFVLVFLFFVISSLIVWGVVIGSLYVQIQVEQIIVRDELQKVKASSESKNINELLDLDRELKRLTNQLTILNFSQTDLLLEIVSKQQNGVSVSLISNNIIEGEKANEIFANFELRGVANTRSDLVAYQGKLSNSEMFEKVDIPFSSFAQNSEISFTAEIETVELNSYFEDLEAEKDIEETAKQVESNLATTTSETSTTTATTTNEEQNED